jgi:dTDP-4-dehydrorhamnose 3,5-epimerase
LKVIETDLPDVLLLEPRVFEDARGSFFEVYNVAVYRELGLPVEFVQDNQSRSAKDVLRGLHYQLANPQGKLVRCTAGEIFDVAVDIRRGSPTFGKWTGARLTSENRRMLWVPPRFAHGFVALTEGAEVMYKCTTLWDAATDRSLLWSDPELGIEWPVETPQLSPKDAAAPRLRDADVFAS